MDGYFTKNEELFHSVTHGIGAVLAALGAVWLIVRGVSHGDPWRVASLGIYGLTLVSLYTISTLYHGVTTAGLKARLRVMDHSAIYFFIAGSYTPFLLLRLEGALRWSMFGIIWALAVAGMVYKLTLLDRFPRLSTALYLAMGWLAVIVLVPLVRGLSLTTLVWLIGGGLIYSAGTLVYHMNGTRYHHVVWHLFVLGGSVCHFVAIARL
ncbi:MAG: hemolysin III family protein [Gemmatimonadota bacterium]